jgi:hypothetical protein
MRNVSQMIQPQKQQQKQLQQEQQACRPPL